ncbi:uncharacterized protein LALA0_S01e05072g [Lachancea lanzarotensis]|uniref:LALA0S01e05072g1_1 n=1 Tax=Lachancea lanzarotensis TaxID=1245769 RepID=A0A0C7N3Y4_9SACH|nr:uncharacterized protein LALA0_S01e05072g [Lachancea lanzarotensis]CEP60191.1 LALA0S01e05072g1_1 [Lachancea lanzarotensis]
MAIGSTLHVSGFPRGVRTRDLAPDFESVGRVVRIEMPPARSEFGRPYAFVEYETPEEAQDAIHQLNQRPLSFDPQAIITVQVARSEARPSRFSRTSDRENRYGESFRGESRRLPNEYPRGPKSFGQDEERDDQYEPEENYRERPSRDDFRRRRPGADEMHYGNTRGSYGSYGGGGGHRGPRSSYQRPEYAMLKRELSPARVRAADGPAPYQDVLHNNAAALKKPRYEGASEKRTVQEQSRSNLDVDMYGDEKSHSENAQKAEAPASENSTGLPPPPAPTDLPKPQDSVAETAMGSTASSANQEATSSGSGETPANDSTENSKPLLHQTPATEITENSNSVSDQAPTNDTIKN